jgi:hypothetical protein
MEGWTNEFENAHPDEDGSEVVTGAIVFWDVSTGRQAA